MKFIKDFFKKIPAPIIEAVKEGSRLVVLAVIAWLLTEGAIDAVLTVIFGTRLDPATKLYISGFVTTGLRSIDKWLHEVGKKHEEKTGKESGLTGGITRF